VTLYAFAGWLASHHAENGRHHKSVEEFADGVGNYAAKRLCDWVLERGGWVCKILHDFIGFDNVQTLIHQLTNPESESKINRVCVLEIIFVKHQLVLLLASYDIQVAATLAHNCQQ